ncbi:MULTISPECIES: glycerol-3-phosphate acyltransferase [unclassified Dolichospermum]|uniref:glycerol-3-phosphate acyltransferase n=1 Tax=unclassified Dolichospermum TaxID=2622029 RepID=UPI001447034B|nr:MULTISPECIES: glycerol-3-phosphate acyltransferase [unclassified Dolichospermum]MTJ17161.1 pyruvate phosphate dikinase PEP/pyruvate-binding protein [Dolichospermum sp. UHCC 0299]MTJ19863.1 pyruvate phosphate dikinase PEP/pyruvate-binding protein [Dolichospermum sp. UHCC 0352]MTJ39632.1 pyruvate phosphate dikinase PEP/pyruvate-binding protein [Dolichospermum sp. UHCC 0406]
MINFFGILIILIFCPLLGAIPLISWITYALSGKKLANMGTGNISVAAAFYHGGKLAGSICVVSEAVKGVAVVTIAQYCFPSQPFSEIIALIALVIGRYVATKGAGTTNVAWGLLAHDPLVAAFVSLLAAIGFLITRSKETIKLGVLVIFPLFVGIVHSQDIARIIAAFALSALIYWIYNQIPDDLNLPVEEANPESQPMMAYLNHEEKIITLDDDLDGEVVGAKSATLSQLKRWGYAVPKGWVLSPDDDPTPLIDFLQPSQLSPLVVRSSAIGEDSQQASAAGQYETILNVISKAELRQAIAQVQASYNHPSAVEYRRRSRSEDAAMGVLIQQQVQSVFSGVAFSRDPISQQGEGVVIEAVSGSPTQIVSGKVTPEQYLVVVAGDEKLSCLQFEGNGKVPQALIKQVAYLARRLERRYLGIPQDIEWSYDGQNLWVLQARPITTLLPLWTRKIAAEVIPGVIHPLTWSINSPLTCGVWGEIFSIVLGDRAKRLDFATTATLHYSRAYFNASLLGEIFLEMGLPPESLEFLTRGASMSKPALNSTLANLPGLTKLLKREIDLDKDFKSDYRQVFIPGLTQLSNVVIAELSLDQLLTRIDLILNLLHRGTYYSILAPLSAAIRQAVLGAKTEEIDNSVTPEVASLRAMRLLVADAKQILIAGNYDFKPEQVFAQLAETPAGERILDEIDELIEDYGYLSEVGTDISVPTWRENPQIVRQLFIQLLQAPELPNLDDSRPEQANLVQKRVDLKGRVTEVYSRLLAELRWTFLALEQIWLESRVLTQLGDIFFLQLDEIRDLVINSDVAFRNHLLALVEKRRSQFLQDSQITQIPAVVYGYNPPHPIAPVIDPSDNILLGIPASQGQIQGRVKVVRTLQEAHDIDKNTILVVPYTDSGWAPILVQAGGLIAEAGGKLSHGAIIAREYGIPAVMDVRGATYLLQDGQEVRIDGYKGTVEIQ